MNYQIREVIYNNLFVIKRISLTIEENKYYMNIIYSDVGFDFDYDYDCDDLVDYYRYEELIKSLLEK